METGKYLFVFTAVTALNVIVFAGSRTLSPQQANPALTGIEKLYVVVEPADSDSEQDALVWSELRKSIEDKLVLEGIEIVSEPESKPKKKDRDIPELRVSMEMLKFTQSEVYVFRLQLSLAAKMYLKKQNISFKARAWETAPTIEAVPISSMPAEVTYAVLAQTEQFIQAYKLANPQSTHPADPNYVTVAIKNSSNPVTATEYKYLASKNSKIFHKADCSWVIKISPENIVGYDTAEQARQAGKRPCKLCKP